MVPGGKTPFVPGPDVSRGKVSGSIMGEREIRISQVLMHREDPNYFPY
jgi:hypothetical protein